jgi:hypothetical protein
MLLLLLLTHLRQVMHPKVKRHDLDSYLVESPIHDTVLLPLHSVLIFSCDQARVDPKCFWFAKAFQPALERELWRSLSIRVASEQYGSCNYGKLAVESHFVAN